MHFLRQQSGSFLINNDTFAIEPIDSPSSRRRKRRATISQSHLVRQVPKVDSNSIDEAGNQNRLVEMKTSKCWLTVVK
jgi:hypothetical protein